MFISSRLEFESCLKKFYDEAKLYSEESPQWTWETLRYAYLRRSILVVVDARNLSLEEDKTVIEELDPSAINPEKKETIQLEHHIVYSTSYQVPVLYFKAYYQDATPLSLQEIFQKIVPGIYHDQVMISQTEHPLTGTPCWFIHPCDTQKLMNIIQFEYSDYIKTWLSFAGPIVKCQIPKAMFLRYTNICY